MKNKILFCLLITVCCISFSQSVTDYFPLKVGNQWKYNYKSTEKEYYDIAFMNKMTTDSGTIHYNIISTVGQDSMIVWSIEENDSLYRRVRDYSQNKDTTFSIRMSLNIKIYEYLDSLHTIKGISYYPPFIFPVQWKLDRKGAPIYRYGSDSSYRLLNETQGIGGTTWNFYDTLLFKNNVGLVNAKSFTTKGPNVPYYYNWEASLISMVTGLVNTEPNIPYQYQLYQNYPNPFNPTTSISYQVPQNTYITIIVYDVLGKEVAKIVDSVVDSGTHSVIWNASTQSSGIYFCKLSSANYTKTIKLVLMK